MSTCHPRCDSTGCREHNDRQTTATAASRPLTGKAMMIALATRDGDI
jgi:hypothetical protein